MTDHVDILRDFNLWRRGAETPMTDPRELGIAIEAVIDEIKRLRRIEGAARMVINTRDCDDAELLLLEDRLNGAEW